MASSNGIKPDPEADINTEAAPPTPASGGLDFFGVQVILRVLLFAVAVTSILVEVTSKQTALVPVPGLPIRVRVEAKFSDQPAFIYLVAAMAVTTLYGIITAVVSLGLNSKPGLATKALLHSVFWDVQPPLEHQQGLVTLDSRAIVMQGGGSVVKPDPEADIKAEAALPTPPSGGRDFFGVHVILRVLLFAAAVTSILVGLTSKQTALVPVPGLPIRVPVEAKFSDQPAFIYLVAAMFVAALYSIPSAVASFTVISKPELATKFLLHFAVLDLLLLGILATAVGAAGGVGYIALKGNNHAGWGKLCNMFEKHCRRLSSSVALSLVASVVLLILVMLSVFSLRRRIPK
ncbi:hypothetical protein Tsubulata_009601 [Turnera subulata]|uniref:CASP-like protein n=1 Tax=Turnera subulata TaxID=218843 RepID=A0A9Q0F116_9ROSI|nr:hypothetical protein Tsubulata_009601 [Turnera subulata]